MSKDGLRRHYDRLTGEERFRLDVLAMARGDAQESERLVSSCPRATYTMTERAFGSRWGAAKNITVRVAVPLMQELGRLRMVDAFRVLAPYQDALSENLALDAYFKGHEAGSHHVWNHAGRTGHPPAWPKGGDPEEVWEPEGDEADPAMERDADELEAIAKKDGEFLPEILDRLEREIAAQALTVWTGYAMFCEEHAGVPAEKLAAVVLEPMSGRIAEMRARAERLGVGPDAGTVEEIRAGAAEAWRHHEGRGGMTHARARLEDLEARTRASKEVLALPNGPEVLYAPEEALGAVGAAIHGTEDALLARFLDAGTTEGLPGLCLALTESRKSG